MLSSLLLECGDNLLQLGCEAAERRRGDCGLTAFHAQSALAESTRHLLFQHIESGSGSFPRLVFQEASQPGQT